jgi:hypothetical protein
MLNRRSQAPDETGHRGITDRADYLIDRFRVRYEFGGGWTCGCADFAASDACRHTREAAGRYIAQALNPAHLEARAPRTLTFDNSASARTLPVHVQRDGTTPPRHRGAPGGDTQIAPLSVV